jgi:hypothetical protein
MADWNDKIIEEFRANDGKVSGPFGAPRSPAHSVGAKTGGAVNPIMYQTVDDDSIAVFASKGGAPTNPDWYHNLVANRDGRDRLRDIEVVTRRGRRRARAHLDQERRRTRLRGLRATHQPDHPGHHPRTGGLSVVIVAATARPTSGQGLTMTLRMTSPLHGLERVVDLVERDATPSHRVEPAGLGEADEAVKVAFTCAGRRRNPTTFSPPNNCHAGR